jgi:arylsulfatase A-like enzyme
MLFICAMLNVGLTLSPAGADDRRPNVLFIAVDDLNHWVGYLRRHPQARTPNIDRLAAKGVSFTRSYCAAPACNPSRAAIMSGLRPATTGVYENNDDWRDVIDQELTLPTTFRRAGYYVAGAGKIYHGSYSRQQEWDDYLTSRGRDPKPKGNGGVGGIRFGAVDCADDDLDDWHVVNYGIKQLQAKHNKPWLLTIGLRKPHMPWYVPRKYFDEFPLKSIELPPAPVDDLNDVPPAGVRMARPERDHRQIVESGRWKEAVQAYLATVAFTDAMVGRLVDALEASAYRDNTIIVLWGDHGWHLGEKQHWRKFALWEETTRAPLIWVVPGVTQPGSVCQRAVDFMSIYPTLTDLCDIPTPKHVEGKSIRALLTKPDVCWDEPALCTYGFKNHTVRSEKWRYIRYANGEEELYDEAADPYEWTNLAQNPEFAEQKQELAKWIPLNNAPDVSDGSGKLGIGVDAGSDE